MSNLTITCENMLEDNATVARGESGADEDKGFAFGDRTAFLADLLGMLSKPGSRLVSAGLYSADVAIAADRANVRLVETVGDSPFSSDVAKALACVESDADVIYVANPNRMSGAGFSLKDMRALAGAVPRGALIVDEHYFDCCGITAASLFDSYTNIFVLRSFAIALGSQSTDAGCVLSGEFGLDRIRSLGHRHRISTAMKASLREISTNEAMVALRVTELHSESLRVAMELTRLGVQCRLTATDFLLLRVASPKDAGNFLTRSRIPVENLDGYPMMRRYLRYHLGSPCSNDRLLEAFRRMPVHHYRMATFDHRGMIVRRGGERSQMKQRTNDRVRHFEVSSERLTEVR